MDKFLKLKGPRDSFIYVNKINDDFYVADPEFHGDIEHVHSDFEARPDDIIICSYPKSGLHWVWEIVTMLKNNTASPAQYLMEQRMLEALPARAMNHIPSPRILVTHARPDQLPSSVLRNGTQVVLILRDPRAVAVSFYHHLSRLSPPANFHGNWKDFTYFFNNGLIPFGSWFRHLRLWMNFIKENTSPNPVYVIYYEDLAKDPVNEIQRLSKALKLSTDTESIEATVKSTRFNKLKPVKDQLAEKILKSEHKKKWKDEKWEIYRKGVPDDWKSHYTVRENEEFLQLFDKEVKGLDFILKSSI